MTDNFKSMQPCDWHEDRLKFPCIIQPKIDGVASFNRHGKLIGRSKKAHENKFVTAKFSLPEYHGFCGEMTTGDIPTGDALCRITSGDLRRHSGAPDVTWWLFDYVTEETKDLGYLQRIALLTKKLVEEFDEDLIAPLAIVPSVRVHSMEELLEWEDRWLEDGYEGIIIRDPYAPYKYGRCGKTFMGAWRVKRFIEEEMLCDGITEGNHNANEATTNELGRTERSTHQENMQPNGLVGSLQGTLVRDVFDPHSKKLLMQKGMRVTVSPGEMPHDMRKDLWENPHKIVKKYVKFKLFPKGIKDKPRFPSFVVIMDDDYSPED